MFYRREYRLNARRVTRDNVSSVRPNPESSTPATMWLFGNDLTIGGQHIGAPVSEVALHG
jgi:hypothetical protein